MTISDEADAVGGAETTATRPLVPPVPQALLGELAFSLGEAGAQVWLEAAVETARDLMTRWRLTPLEVLTGGTMSLCLLCADATGRRCVLKVPGGPAEARPSAPPCGPGPATARPGSCARTRPARPC